jgi:hypothetical protein
MRVSTRTLRWMAFAGVSLAGIAVMTPACRRERPTVSAQVQLSRAQVLPGQALELHYRFETLPDFRGIPYDGYVFVHFIDPLDTLSLTADHRPPKSTRDWKAGEVIEYRRVVFIPDYLYPGTYRVVLGIYDVSGTHPRIPLQGLKETSRRAYQVGEVEVLPPPLQPLVRYVDGWYDLEANPADPGQRWRWTTRRAVAQLLNPKKNARLYIELDSNRDAFKDAPQQVTLVLNGQPLDEWAVRDPSPVLKVYPLTAERLGLEEYVTLEVRVDKTFVPAALGLGSDARELGVRVFHLVLQEGG